MKNSAIYYGVIAVGVIALLVLGAGVLLLIVGIAGMFMARPKATAK